MAIKQILSLVQFTRGTSLVWDSIDTSIPDKVATFSIDDGVFKLGDGVSTYNNLPVLFTFNEMKAAVGGSSNLFEIPTIPQQGMIAVVKLNTSTGLMEYGSSGVTLSSLLASIASLEATNTSQDVDLAVVLDAALSIDASINTAAEGNIVVINNGRYSDSGMSPTDIQSQVLSVGAHGAHMTDPIFYSDAGLSNEIDKSELIENNIYYVKIAGFHDLTPNFIYNITTDSPGVTITPINAVGPANGVFSLTLGNITENFNKPIILNFIVDDGVSPLMKAVPIVVPSEPPITTIIAAVYGGANNENMVAIVSDSNNNIICAGYTYSEGVGSTTYTNALVVKFDSNLNILARKIYGGANNDYFYGVTIDSNNNIICAGHTFSEGTAGSTLVVKFDTNLNILARKYYGGANNDIGRCVAIDSNDNIICAGHTFSEGTAGSALVVKFDTNLNILARKYYDGANEERFKSVTIDSNNNIICAGWTHSEGTAGSALVVKFDTNLNILARKYYGGANYDEFYGVAVDSNNNIICVGHTFSEGVGSTTYQNALVVKFDSNLNILARKIYGGAVSDYLHCVAVDSNNNIICVGGTYSEGVGSTTYTNALVVKFDSNLNILARKIYGGANDDEFFSVAVDLLNNVICGGEANSEGAGIADMMVLKLSPNIPSGTVTGTVLTGLTLADSTLTLADSALTLANSNLTLADSTLTLSISTLTLTDSALTLEKETLY
jgi:hypothetical protein